MDKWWEIVGEKYLVDYLVETCLCKIFVIIGGDQLTGGVELTRGTS